MAGFSSAVALEVISKPHMVGPVICAASLYEMRKTSMVASFLAGLRCP